MPRPIVSAPVRMTAAQAMALPSEHHAVVRVGSRYMCEACDLVTGDLTRVAAHVTRTQFVVRDAR